MSKRSGALRIAGFVVGLCLATAPSLAQTAIETDADQLLRAMSTYLAGLKTFTVDYDVDQEIVEQGGQKLQFSASGTVAVERPGKLHVTRQGSFVDAELVVNGKAISLHGKEANVYAQIESPGSRIDDAIEELRASTGLDAAGADLLAADPYSVLTAEVDRGIYVGLGYVDGVECEHLAFRNPRVDWQIWIQAGDKPLPMKYVVTTKWVTGAPQYSIRFRSWNTNPQIADNTFEFVPPSGASRVEEVRANEVGELMVEVQQ
jgi:hypothetical protein